MRDKIRDRSRRMPEREGREGEGGEGGGGKREGVREGETVRESEAVRVE